MSMIFLTRRLCKTVIFKWAAVAFILCSIALYFVQPNMIWAGLFLNSMNGFFHTMLIVLVFAMTADSVDWGEYVNGKRATAMTFSGHLFALKMGAAIGGAMLGWILAGYGYQEPVKDIEQVQTSLTLSGIVLLMTLFPAICAVFVYLCGWFYRLTSSKLLEIQAELNQRAPTS
jgi:GPH family glycoside/pentoside/hexuronide:cation symporter